MPKAFEEMFKSLAHGDPILSILSLAIIAPIAEELFFRGWMLRGFFANYSAKKSIWMTALIFGLFHLNPWQFLVAMPIGLLLGWLVLRTDSMAPCMIGHCVFNFTGVKLLLPLAALFGHSEESINAMTHLPWDMVAFGALLFGVGMVLLLRALPSPNDTTAPVPVNA
ncbi:MAG: CPBP family intramembrane metalloprotease [Verrucomicrobia bacterium]|nr:CPBP family intramembrane metalloprotease [Verrucomicrobiota bacterium]